MPRGPKLDFRTFWRPVEAAMFTAKAASLETISALGDTSWRRDMVLSNWWIDWGVIAMSNQCGGSFNRRQGKDFKKMVKYVRWWPKLLLKGSLAIITMTQLPFVLPGLRSL